MANAENFAEAEWAVICDAAHAAGLAMMLVGSSGLVGSLREMLVAGRTAAGGARDASELIRALCAPAAMQAMQTRVAEAISGGEGEDPRAILRERALGWLGEAVAVLRRKAPEELVAYRTWVLGFAGRVAAAGSEGGPLGIRGERVSAEEADLLASLRAVFVMADGG
jgi:hypothetical protein